jgi:hypothetical protein
MTPTEAIDFTLASVRCGEFLMDDGAENALREALQIVEGVARVREALEAGARNLSGVSRAAYHYVLSTDGVAPWPAGVELEELAPGERPRPYAVVETGRTSSSRPNYSNPRRTAEDETVTYPRGAIRCRLLVEQYSDGGRLAEPYPARPRDLLDAGYVPRVERESNLAKTAPCTSSTTARSVHTPAGRVIYGALILTCTNSDPPRTPRA